MATEDIAPQENLHFFTMINVQEDRPLLQHQNLMQIALTHLQIIVSKYQSQLWGYVILPKSVEAVIEVPTENHYHLMIEEYKKHSEQALIQVILTTYTELVDEITYFHPIRAKSLYRIWQQGYHTQQLSSIYAISNKIADLVNKPAKLGLVENASQWEFSSYRET